jgi:hypothetical protein
MQPNCLRNPAQLGQARFPAQWNHFAEKKSRQISYLEHVLVAKVLALWRNMLWRGVRPEVHIAVQKALR